MKKLALAEVPHSHDDEKPALVAGFLAMFEAGAKLGDFIEAEHGRQKQAYRETSCETCSGLGFCGQASEPGNALGHDAHRLLVRGFYLNYRNPECSAHGGCSKVSFVPSASCGFPSTPEKDHRH
eukprot:4793560-Amphidinium_carterae.1